MYKKYHLHSGAELVTIHSENLETVTIMILVKTGTMFEQHHEHGIAHFLEHMCFKDTLHYKKEKLMLLFEEKGVVTNAFTGHECTGYFGKMLKEKYREVLPLLAELYYHPQFPTEDIKIEKNVVIGEINMYKDDPITTAAELHEEYVYGKGKPHGTLILGTKESVQSITQEMLFDFHERFYIPVNTTIVVSGNFNQLSIEEECNNIFSIIKNGNPSAVPLTQLTVGPQINHIEKESEQSHVIISYHAVSQFDTQTRVLKLLATILGQGMTSRLFIRLREKMGAGYYVAANLEQTFDNGIFVIRTGTEHNRVEEIIAAIKDECEIIKNNLLTEKELQKVKDITMSKFVMALESSDAIAEYYGIRDILGLPYKSLEIIKEEIEKVTAEDILKCAQKYFVEEGCIVSILGKK